MQKIYEDYQFSPTDLANFLSCRRSTSLDMKRADGKLAIPIRHSDRLERLAEKGLLHEQAYLHSLERQGLQVEKLTEFDDRRQVERTIELMRQGVDIIYQGALAIGAFAGRADFLVKVEKPSNLGGWSYEVVDTKLSQSTKAGTILQLCCYSECVAAIQGCRSDAIHVVKPVPPNEHGNKNDQEASFAQESFRLDAYWSYFELVKRQFIESVSDNRLDSLYPEPVAYCDVCRWFAVCDKRRRDDDHLSFVAGIQTSQINEIRRQELLTLQAFAQADAASLSRPAVGSKASLLRVHQQARIQHQGREAGKKVIEFLPLVWPEVASEKQPPPVGFLRLPEPDPGDIYLDFEGNPYAPDGVLEYLFGYVDRERQYTGDWCFSRKAEREAFDRLMRYLIKRRASHPNFHVYHFAPYEPAAMKRMASRHQMHEEALDDFLRHDLFVDLYAVVRQSMVLSVESYSLKKIEAFYDFERAADLADVRSALSVVEWAIEMGGSGAIDKQVLELVAAYNQDDCVSTMHLHRWLEEQRLLVSTSDGALPRPVPKGDRRDAEKIEQNATFAEMRDRLKTLAGDLQETEAERARWLAGHMLEYFFREAKTVWWEYFRHRDLEDDDLLYENAAIAGLEHVRQIPPEGRGRIPTSLYRYPAQEHKLKVGDSVSYRDDRKIGDVVEIDHSARTISIKKTGETADFHPTSVFAHSLISPGDMPASLLEFAAQMGSLDWPSEPHRCARVDLICRRPPRLRSLTLPFGGELIASAIKVALDLDHSVLPIQGPPGTGKTHLASRMIVALAQQGMKVGVTAVSHKVISNLLERSAEFDETGTCSFAHKPKSGERETAQGVQFLKDNAKAIEAVDAGAVVGATTWLWSSEPAKGKLDYLFIDEAGQMSLAVALTAMRSAKNVILLGDPQQLEQPQRAAHPEGADVAALAHLIGEAATISSDRGIFLAQSHRLHPDICRFTSEQFYDGRLESVSACQNQAILNAAPFSGTGLRIVFVDHRGNQNRSDEEVEVVTQIVQRLLGGEARWTDKNGKEHKLTEEHILIVAPYNAQVDAIAASVDSKVRVGTVDKFQGQEAPIVIYSTASSSAEDAPRGMEFLYDPNRLNVATSRAMCLTIMVASPKLFEPSCRTPRQMKLANTFCRYADLATQVDRESIS